MPVSRYATVVGALCLSSTVLVAQDQPVCSGPGAAFGVTSYRCASCGVKQGDGVRTQYIFEAEPVILETTPSSALKPGDVIVAVDGDPIMTQAGADRFTYPATVKAVVTVRRRNTRVDVDAPAMACRPALPAAATAKGNEPLVVVDGVVVPGIENVSRSDIESVDVLRGMAASALYRTRPDRAVIVITTKSRKGPTSIRQNAPAAARPDTGPLIIVDGVPLTNEPRQEPTVAANRRFGFAIGCETSCSRGELHMGGEKFTFETYPRVVALDRGGVADRAGVRIGDLVTKIDGKSVLDKGGVRRFSSDDKRDRLTVTIKRDGAEIVFTLDTR